MRIGDPPLRGIDDRVGDVARAALRQRGQGDHGGRRAQVALAGADEAFVEKFVEAKAGVGMDVASVKPAEAIHRDGVGPVLPQHILHAQVHGGRGLERFPRDARNHRRRLLPTVGDRPGGVLVRVLPCLVHFGERHVDDGDAEKRSAGSGILAADREDLGFLHPPEAVFHRNGGDGIGLRGIGRRPGHPRRTDPRGGRDEVGGRPAPFHHGETLHRFDQVLRPGRRDEADVGGLGAQKSGIVDEEAAAAAVLEVGVKDRLARCRDRLHDLVPAVHLVNQVAVDRSGPIGFQDLVGIIDAGGGGGHELEAGAPLRQRRPDAIHHGHEIEALVRPIGAGLLRCVQGVDDPDLRVVVGGGCHEAGRRHREACRSRAHRAAPGPEKTASAQSAAATSTANGRSVHDRNPPMGQETRGQNETMVVARVKDRLAGPEATAGRVRAPAISSATCPPAPAPIRGRRRPATSWPLDCP